MGARTAQQAKTEVQMSLIFILTVVLITLPMTMSLLRDTAVVEMLIMAVPFLLNIIAVVCMAWAAKSEQ